MNGAIALMVAVILIVTVISGSVPFIARVRNLDSFDFPMGEALANGIFLGVGLIHMLSDSAAEFLALGINYPYPFVIAGFSFLFFLLLENISLSSNIYDKNQTSVVAIITTAMLSIHSFLAGTALGLSTGVSISFILFIAILAHKWAASLALSVYINKSSLQLSSRVILFIFFALMVPAGIFLGNFLKTNYLNNSLVEPTILSMGAGTFIYLGSLHGFTKSMTIKECFSLYYYLFVVIGFLIMAIVAIWT